MHVRCPHCRHPIDIVADDTLVDVTCPECGSHISLISDDTTATIPSGGPQRLAHFELLDQVGMGQFGVVWKARDTTLQRIVALKVPRRGQLSPEEVEFFFRDARAAAQLKHPHIVSVHEVGRDGETIFIASEFIDGATLKEWLTVRRPTPREAAGLLIPIAEAVHHAHERGVVHRDLKPGNILMDQEGRPYVTDFGLARRDSGETTMTVDGQLLGTPAYMSPEQARGQAHHADARSDVYALGVILFELLTGEVPFRGEKRMLIMQILQDEPPSPRRLLAAIPHDLETIALKCLEKEPPRRYSTAGAVAEELQRHLAGEPIQARPVGPGERLWRWCRRKPAVAALSLSVVAALLVGSAVSIFFAITAQRRAEESERAWAAANEERGRVVAQQSINNKLLADLQARRGLRMIREESNPGGLLHMLAGRQLAEQLPEIRESLASLWGAYHRPLSERLVQVVGHAGPVVDVAISPDGKLFATASEDGMARLWDLSTGRPRSEPLPHSGKVYMVAFSPDSTLLATASEDRTARLWKTDTGQPLGPLLRHQESVRVVAFSRDGKLLATGSDDKTMGLWNTTDGAAAHEPFAHDDAVTAVVFSPSGKLLANTTHGGTVRVWNTADWTPAFPPLEYRRGHRGRLSSPQSLAFSPDGSLLAVVASPASDASRAKRDVQLINAKTGQPESVRMAHSMAVWAVTFSPDGKTLATASADKKFYCWEFARGAVGASTLAHDGDVWTIAFSPDGKTIATGSWDGTVKLWSRGAGAEPATLREAYRHYGRVWKVAFSPDGTRVVSASDDGSVRVWNVRVETFARNLPHVQRVYEGSFSPDGKRVITASGDRTAQVWDAATGQPSGAALQHDAAVHSADFSPDGSLIVTACRHGATDGTLQLWRADSGQRHAAEMFHPHVSRVSFSPSGKLLVSRSRDGTLRLWDVASGEPRGEPIAHRQLVTCCAFSPDEKLLASGSEDDTVRLWEVATGGPQGVPCQHDNNVQSLAFSPDGKVLASCAWDSTVRLWSPATGASLGPSLQHFRGVLDVAFSPDGKLLASVSEDNYLRLWSTSTWKLRGDPLTVAGNFIERVRFSPNSQLVATGGHQGVTVWQTATGLPMASWPSPDVVTSIRFGADGTSVLVICNANTAQLYRLWTVPAQLREIELRTWLALGARMNDAQVIEPIPWHEWQQLRDELAKLQPSGRFAGE